MLQLIGLQKQNTATQPAEYPFSVAVIRNLQALTFRAPVCFWVGENGSGKSTLLEGLAAKLNLPTVGARPVSTDPSLAAARNLAQYLRPVWQSKVVHRGFFLRAEDFFGFIQGMDRMRQELAAEEEDIRRQMSELGSSAYGIGLATGSMRGNLNAVTKSYGENPDGMSHGESFLHLFRSRLSPNGIYLLDEPEAALSPMRQLAFLDLLLQGVQKGSQFIIATHSPIILSYPGAQIFQFDSGRLTETAYQDLEHVRFTKDFLQNPQAFLHHMTDELPE
ncbi:MAG: AAA family ATPase [Negativicutes bacterium]|nr:AAA family ATPase [Negativicutes bacterium]